MKPIAVQSPRFAPVAGALALLFLLSGCVSAQVNDVVSAPAAPSQPRQILVALDISVPVAGDDAALAQEVGETLRAAVIQDLADAGVSAQPLAAGARPAGVAVLHLAIAEADSGSAWERFVIGFGAGRAKLRATAALETEAAGRLTSFSTSSDSGRRPGLIMPAGVAAATRTVIPLAIGGTVKTVTSLRDGLDRPLGKTAQAVVEQLEAYYRQAGWTWPA